MSTVKLEFAQQLREAMVRSGYVPRPAVLEREFNLRYLGTPMSLHGVRRWLLGETLPSADKIVVLADWLKIDTSRLVSGFLVDGGATLGSARWRAELPTMEREAVDTYLALPVQQRKIVREVILAFARTASVA